MMKSNLISDWISVSQEAVNRPESEVKNGIKIQFMISPFDVPVATRAGIDTETGQPGKYIVEFKYISTEEKITHVDPHTRGVQLEVGKNSRKIYRIIVDLAEFATDAKDQELSLNIVFVIENSLKEIETTKSALVNQGNADAIRRIFSNKSNGKLPISPVLQFN